MERARRSHYRTRGGGYNRNGDSDWLLQWGNRNRLRCVKNQPGEPPRDDATAKVIPAAAAGRGRAKGSGFPARMTSPIRHRAIRNNSDAMRGQHQPEEQPINGDHAAAASSPEDNREKGGGGGEGSSSGSDGAAWPKFEIALTIKEKEEDFMAFKGSKLPSRPKKRTKIIQRALNQVSPGEWLCDLSLERYQVREKKISKKKPRGLKAMGNIDGDSQ